MPCRTLFIFSVQPQRIGSRAESLSALKYLDTNPLFSKILTESLVQNYLLEDILPDVLNEVVIEGLDTDNSLVGDIIMFSYNMSFIRAHPKCFHCVKLSCSSLCKLVSFQLNKR